MSRAGFLSSRHDGRFIYYVADFKAMKMLIAYLTTTFVPSVLVTIIADPPNGEGS